MLGHNFKGYSASKPHQDTVKLKWTLCQNRTVNNLKKFNKELKYGSLLLILEGYDASQRHNIDEKLPTDLAFLTNFPVKFNTSSISSFELKTLCSTEHCFHLTDFCSKNAAAQKKIITKS